MSDAEGNINRNAQGQPITQIVQTYTAEQVVHIKLALTLRRALVARHTAQVITKRAMGMLVLALRQRADEQAWDRICKAVNQRCAGNRISSVIRTLVALVSRHLPTASDEPVVVDTFRAYLHQIVLDRACEKTQPEQASQSDAMMQPAQPLLLRIVAALVRVDGNTGIMPLRMCLEHWYCALAEKEREQRFTADDRRLMTIALEPDHQYDEEDRLVGMGLLLQHWLYHHCTLSTDVLLLVSLSEKAVRRIGDGVQLLSGILSNCYGEVCSSQRYPLSSELREGVFFNRGGAILGWCQLVADYVTERDKQRPGNTPPPRKKGEQKNVSRVDFFTGHRVVRLILAYSLWKREDAAYKQAVATAAPVGPDEGKTLGNPNSHKELRRYFAGNRRRRTTILGRGVIGKKGARRMKKWLLPPEERRVTLKHLDVLLYPELAWSDAERIAAEHAPHPYWVKRTRRGITAVRPTRFRPYPGKYPQRLCDLSREQQIKLREELREQERYAAHFEAFGQTLDHFLEGAPPAPPFIAPILLAEADRMALPPEAQLIARKPFEDYKAQFDQVVNWYRDFKPREGKPKDDYRDEKLYDVETLQNRELEWSAATLAKSHPQPIAFKRSMHTNFSPRSFALLYYLRQQNGQARHRFIFACELVGQTAAEREQLLKKDQVRAERTVENFFVNHPDQPVQRPENTTVQFFATQMGVEHQERMLLEYMDWRRREPATRQHLISTARIVGHQRTSQRTDWYAHLPVPLPAPTRTATLDAVIGWHEHEGTFFYGVIDLEGKLLALGEVDLPAFLRPKRKDGMTNDNFAFETAVRMIWRSMTRQYFHKFRDHPKRYTACIGIEDTAWKQELIGTEATANRQNVSLPRQRIIEIVTYKAVRNGLPPPLSMRGIAPVRDCGHCGGRREAGSGIERRPVTHCFHCQTLGIEHELTWSEDTVGKKSAQCLVCGRRWQEEEPQFKCQHCRTEQHARYNTALATVHRTVDMLVGRKRQPNTNEEQSEE